MDIGRKSPWWGVRSDKEARSLRRSGTGNEITASDSKIHQKSVWLPNGLGLDTDKVQGLLHPEFHVEGEEMGVPKTGGRKLLKKNGISISEEATTNYQGS